MSAITEQISGRYLNANTRFPPFSLFINYDIICNNLGSSHPKVINALYSIFEAIVTRLPESYMVDIQELLKQRDKFYDGRGLTVPLYSLVDPARVIIEILYQFYHELEDEGYEIRKKLQDNENALHGLTQYARRTKGVPLPTQVKLEPEALAYAYLKGTPFELLFNTGLEFRIKRERFKEHGCLFAKSGHGKTQSLRAIVAQFLQEPDPPALFLIDSLGSLIEDIDRLEVFNTTLKNRLLILDPSNPHYMPRLNFFNLQSDDLCFYLFKAIDQGFTSRQATMISYLMEHMRNVPQPSIFKLVQVCESKTNIFPDVMPKLSPFARAFFENQFFVAKGGDTLVQQTKSQIAQRLYTLGRLPKFADIFSAQTGLFDPYECMQHKRVVLINTDARSSDQGGLGEASAIFGRYILAQCLAAARRRPKNQRHLALLVVDEAKAYMDEQSALILSDARQFGLGMLLASQFPHQLVEGVRREINTNTSIRMMGAIEYSVAAQYARDMFCEPEFITKMKSYDRSHAEWAAFVSGMDHAVRLTIPFGAIERMPKQRDGPATAIPPMPPIMDKPSQTPKDASSTPRPTIMAEEDEQQDFDRCDEEAMREQAVNTTDDDHIRPVRE